MSIHTIWVPKGWSVEQVWEAIKRGDATPTGGKGRWVNVDENGKLAEADG